MNKLILKVNGFDEVSNSLLISFASDDTTKTVDEYPSMAFQPSMYPDITDPQTLIKTIAITGLTIVDQQKKMDSWRQNQTNLEALKALVGQTIEYNVSDIAPVPPSQTLSEVSV